MQFGCEHNTGDTVTLVYLYNFQNNALCFRNNIKWWKIAVFIQNNFPIIKAYKQKFCYFWPTFVITSPLGSFKLFSVQTKWSSSEVWHLAESVTGSSSHSKVLHRKKEVPTKCLCAVSTKINSRGHKWCNFLHFRDKFGPAQIWVPQPFCFN